MSLTLNGTRLYDELIRKCGEGAAYPLDGDSLLGRLKDATREMATVLNRACISFEDYTLHDEQHALRVTELMYQLMGDQIAGQLNVVEICLLILAAYGHDTGMAVGRERREELESEAAYQDYLYANEQLWIEAEEARDAGDQQGYEFLRSQLFQGYSRDRHHLLSAELMRTHFADSLRMEEKSLVEPLAALCRSHGESTAKVASYEPYPFATKFLVDTTFLACVLRLADYLDLDAARAPKSLFALVRPETERSRREWRKHQAANFFVSEKTIRFAATFDDFFEEKALRDTLDGIEQERRDCMDLLRGRQGDSEHRLALDVPVEREITSNGYIYEEFQFQLEYRQILSLLMGTRLYADERVFLRELLQNSLDACRHAQAAAEASGRHGYQGRITIRRRQQGDRDVIEVTDNGSGMTRSIIRKYLMRVGRSYYQSFAFRQRQLGFVPVSQFGIGILSCFMLADNLEIETCPDPVVYSDVEPEDRQALRLEIHGPHQFFVVRPMANARVGTTVRVFLKKGLLEPLLRLVERYVVRIPYAVEIHDSEEPSVELQTKGFDFKDVQWATSFMAIPSAFGYATRDMLLDGRLGFELKGRIRFFLLEAHGRRHLQLASAGNYSWVGFSPGGHTLVVVQQLSEEVFQTLEGWLASVRALASAFDKRCRQDIEAILRRFEVLCDQLLHQHSDEHVRPQWQAVIAQIDALYANPAFQNTPACITAEAALEAAKNEVKAFVSGKLHLASPGGFLSQDGINITTMIDLPSRLNLGIGYLFNLDLCGEHRLSLTAARDRVIEDDRLLKLIAFFHSEIGTFLGDWFREEEIDYKEIDQYTQSVPRLLAESVQRAYHEGLSCLEPLGIGILRWTRLA